MLVHLPRISDRPKVEKHRCIGSRRRHHEMSGWHLYSWGTHLGTERFRVWYLALRSFGRELAKGGRRACLSGFRNSLVTFLIVLSGCLAAQRNIFGVLPLFARRSRKKSRSNKLLFIKTVSCGPSFNIGFMEVSSTQVLTRPWFVYRRTRSLNISNYFATSR